MDNALIFLIFAILSLFSMIAAPFLLVSVIKKTYNNSEPLLICLLEECLLECVLLIIGAVSLWYWLLHVFVT
jgi:hypothetical protein